MRPVALPAIGSEPLQNTDSRGKLKTIGTISMLFLRAPNEIARPWLLHQRHILKGHGLAGRAAVPPQRFEMVMLVMMRPWHGFLRRACRQWRAQLAFRVARKRGLLQRLRESTERGVAAHRLGRRAVARPGVRDWRPCCFRWLVAEGVKVARRCARNGRLWSRHRSIQPADTAGIVQTVKIGI